MDNAQSSITVFLFNLFLAALLSYWLGRMYIRHGNAISNRPAFARNFVLIALTTMLVISIVKSSLALSLGLIGALSIVRFRAAIKEPEELSYLFLAIAIGLGIGANQHLYTVTAVLAVFAFLKARNYLSKDPDSAESWDPDLYLTIAGEKSDKVALDALDELVEGHTVKSLMKRANCSENRLDVMYLIQIDDRGGASRLEQSLRQLDPALSISFLETR